MLKRSLKYNDNLNTKPKKRNKPNNTSKSVDVYMPITGTIVKVECKIGSLISVNDPLIRYEIITSEGEEVIKRLYSTYDGKISDILFKKKYTTTNHNTYSNLN